jgi:hypothetical protein
LTSSAGTQSAVWARGARDAKAAWESAATRETSTLHCLPGKFRAGNMIKSMSWQKARAREALFDGVTGLPRTPHHSHESARAVATRLGRRSNGPSDAQ